MAENIYLDLSEEMEQDLVSRYQTLCDDLTSELNNMKNDLETLCQATQYEPMVDVVNNTINLFNEEIHDHSNQAFDGWTDGSGSFTAAAENSQAGDDAIATAQQIEQSIRDIYESFWASHPLGESVGFDTSRPKVKDENFDDLKEIYNKVSQSVDKINEDSINQIKELGEDDPTYNVIIPAMKALSEPMKNAFEQFCAKVDEAREKSEALKQQQAANNEEASNEATQTAASSAEVAEALRMYDDI